MGGSRFHLSAVWQGRWPMLVLGTAAQADVFNMGGTRNADGTWTGLASLEIVPVGNLGNTGEWSGQSYGGYGPDRICGAVGYAYNIGKYEVTAGQYTEFLNAVARTSDPYGLYNASMWSDNCRLQDPADAQFGRLHVQRGGRPGEPAGELRKLGRRGAVRQLAAQRPAHRAGGPLDH